MIKKKTNIHIAKIKLLIELGARVDLCSTEILTSKFVKTALELAAFSGNLAVIQLIIISGGVIFKPLSTESQNNANIAMFEIYQKARILLSIQDKKQEFHTIVPRELLAIIIRTFAETFI